MLRSVRYRTSLDIPVERHFIASDTNRRGRSHQEKSSDAETSTKTSQLALVVRCSHFDAELLQEFGILFGTDTILHQLPGNSQRLPQIGVGNLVCLQEIKNCLREYERGIRCHDPYLDARLGDSARLVRHVYECLN